MTETKPLQEFYVTFMQKQAFKNKYVRIMATNGSEARDAMFAHFGDKWMTSYEGSAFEGQIERFGLEELCCILVVNHGTKEYPSIEYKLL